MGNYMKRRRRSTNIDITPLMDLTFMLLIIFIITVPAMEYSTDVTPPSMDTPKTVESITDKLVVTLGKQGGVMVDGETVPKEQLLQRLRQAVSARPQLNVLIISDGSRQYEEVIEIHRYAYHAGAKNIYLVTQAERH